MFTLPMLSFRPLSRIWGSLTSRLVLTRLRLVCFRTLARIFLGVNAEWAKKRAKTFMFPSPREDFWGSNPLTVDIKIRTGIMFPYPHEDFFWGAN